MLTARTSLWIIIYTIIDSPGWIEPTLGFTINLFAVDILN